MDIKEFGNIIVAEIADVLGDSVEVSYKEVLKNNGIICHAVHIKKKGENIAPTIYLDQYYKDYKNGIVLMKIVRNILEFYRKHAPEGSVDVNYYEDFSKICGKLFFKVINFEKNRKYLEDVPFVMFEDLALVPLVNVDDEFLGPGVIVVKKDHLKNWEISEDELWENIYENAPTAQPFTIEHILETLGDKGKELAPFLSQLDMYVISNEAKTNGAGVFLYPGVSEKISEKLGGDFIVLPASIHEAIVMPYFEEEGKRDFLYSMVKEVNSMVVGGGDMLSDSVYLYEAENNTVRIL